MLVDALSPVVARATADMVLAVQDRQHEELLHCEFGLLLNKIQDMKWNVNAYFTIFKTIQHIKSSVADDLQYKSSTKQYQ